MRLEGIATAVKGLNQRTEAGGFRRLSELLEGRASAADEGAYDKLVEINKEIERIGATGEAEFGRLGMFATATFAAAVKETGDVIGALQQIDPTLQILAAAQKEFGFETSTTFGRLLAMRETVTANEDVAAALQGLNSIMKGLGDAGVVTRELFEAFGQDAAAQFAELQSRGVDANQALILMQPSLQKLWEQQKRFGGVTDEATAALLRQAEEQGIVGASMQSVSQQILDVLLAIGDVLGAKLPASLERFQTAGGGAFDAVVDAARSAAGEVEGAFAGISVPPIRIGYVYDGEGGEPLEGGDRAMPGAAFWAAVPFTPGGRAVRVAERESEYILNGAQLEGLVSRALAAAGGRGGGGSTFILRQDLGGEIRETVIETANEGLANRRIRVPAGVAVERVY